MPTIEKKEPVKTIQAKTVDTKNRNNPSDWWNAGKSKDLGGQLLSTILYLREKNWYRYRQASIYTTLYGNLALSGWAGTNFTRMNTGNRLPADRPTMSVITSCTDTIVSRITQEKPRPLFLTDNSDYKQRTLAKQMNRFIQGEFHQTKAYRLGEECFRDAAVLGTGALKILEDDYNRVALERRLTTELLVDPNDSFYGYPRQLYEMKLVDRGVLLARFPNYRKIIETADPAYVDNQGEMDKTIADLVLVGEGWHLRSGPNANDGLHALVCSSGVIFDESYEKKSFPFVFMPYAPRQFGFWAQGLAERQFGTQMEITKLLITISRSINLLGVPRVFIEKGSGIVKAHFNNEVGAVIEYKGTLPSFQVAPCNAPEVYQQLQRLVTYAYEQEGISQLSATSQKPAGLNSGEAIRSYDSIQTDRFASLQKRYQDFYVELAYQIIDKAMDIAKRDGKYQTVFPDKDGTRQIDIPDFKILDDPFVIQSYDTSSLPKDPAGRLEKIVEMMQAGIVDPQEGRRLLGYPDIEQVDKLANAGEERIYQILDKIVEDGVYTEPDTFIDFDLALKISTQYYNLYIAAGLEEKKAQMLRTFFVQVQDAKKALIAAMAPPPAPMPMEGGAPQAMPLAPPTNELLPTMPQQ